MRLPHKNDPFTDADVIDSYCGLMEELRRRIALLGRILAGDFSLDERTTEEWGYLQLRMICELIAVSCLLAHDDPLIRRKGPTGDYHAGHVIQKMEKLRPKFFPQVAKRVVRPDGTIGTTTTSERPLNKSELVKLYKKCNEVLHIGGLSGVNRNWTRKTDMPAVIKWVNKIVSLLNIHRINLVRSRHKMYVEMISPPVDGRTQAWITVESLSGRTKYRPR